MVRGACSRHFLSSSRHCTIRLISSLLRGSGGALSAVSIGSAEEGFPGNGSMATTSLAPPSSFSPSSATSMASPPFPVVAAESCSSAGPIGSATPLPTFQKSSGSEEAALEGVTDTTLGGGGGGGGGVVSEVVIQQPTFGTLFFDRKVLRS